MTDRTAEEIEADYITKLGEDFGTKMYWLENALTNLTVEWQIFEYLFVGSEECVQELKKTSGITAYIISKTLHESIVLGLCRLTDPAVSGRGAGERENLSLASLSEHLGNDLVEEYKTKVEEAKEACSKAREWRNKLIAHADLGRALGYTEVDGISPNYLKEGLTSIAEALNFVQLKLFDSTTSYDLVILPYDDHRNFMRTLFLGNKTKNELSEQGEKALRDSDHAELRRLKQLLKVPDWVYGSN